MAPIPIKKQTMDITAVKNCILVAREGGTICIAPEGNRTYSGRTEYMRPSIASLAKKLDDKRAADAEKVLAKDAALQTEL